MTPNRVPHLCGGILFGLLLEARLPRTKARNKLNGGSDGLTAPDLYGGLIYVVMGDGGHYGASTLEKCASDYKKCVSSKGSYVPFTDPSTISSFSSAVKRKDPALLERITGFKEKFLSIGKCEWLVRALIETIQKDEDIDRDTEFSINYTKKVKVSVLHNERDIIFQPFMISVIDFVLQYSPDAESGRETFETWYSQAGKKSEWKFHSDIGSGIQPINLSFAMPTEQDETTTKESSIETTAKDEDTRTDDEVIIDNLRKPLEMFANALEAQKHQMAEKIRANNKKTDSPEDESNKVYSAFKQDSFEILKYCIDTDISAEPVKITLPDEINALLENWQYDARKISNQEQAQIVAETLKALFEFEGYLSEKYMRYNSNCEALIFRNGSAEEGERLRNELHPESLRIRKALAALFKKMWPAPNFDEPETVEAEVVDDKMSSGAAEDAKTVVIQNQTNIGKQTINNYDIKNSTVTFNR